ncbi:sugar ABC transporter permease [Amycolatopsis acidiphila]|uniref:Sugar ABC transporter permease n=1 Tax=Amycolatopsis acidiphila TaxID=715473 RepID=A0A558ANW9_9PSEU|nr:sugar ABC transporter permease [Amycolatopsis acidiphila]TVT25953.1 sugar ABC transporter permease [Amycolatopsis acidiphila]UIJ63336.1 sugar ABC transporter permease [Amycolatopsis acidiphila]GHG75094.1 sugar transporter [Amycolatopsis acidiphila]
MTRPAPSGAATVFREGRRGPAVPAGPRTAKAAAPRGRRTFSWRRRLAPYAFVLPFVAVFLAFSIYPLFFTLRLSFTDWHGTGAAQWVGFGNYRYLLANSAFWSSLGNSAVLWLLVVPVQLVLSVIVAVLLNTIKRLRSFYRVAFVVPFVMPLVAIAQIWIVLFDQNYGAVNAVLGAVGLPPVGWLVTSAWAKPTLALLFLWKTTGFVVLIVLSGLQQVEPGLYEAASLDGAGRVRQLWSITVPLLRRSLMFSVVLQTLAVFQIFTEPYVVTKGGPYNSTTTAGLFLFNHINRADLGTGAANSFLLVIVVMAVSLLFVRLLRAED